MICMLSHGEYSDYHIDIHLQSDQDQDIEALVKEFKALYNWPLVEGEFNQKQWNRDTWQKFEALKEQSSAQMHSDFPEVLKDNPWIEDWENYFQDFLTYWLIHSKGFVEIEVTEYRIDYEP